MRVLFWLVLVANLLFFGYMQWGSALLRGEDGLQAQPPLNPDKIKLLSVPASAVAAAPVAASQAAALPSPAASPQAASRPQANAPAVAANGACMEWGEFSGDDLARATAALAAMKLGSQLAQHEVEYDSGYWVYLPPQGNRAKAERKVAQLKALGVADYFIVQEPGKWQNAVSLGVFKTQAAAQKFLDGIQQKGVKSAVVGERQAKLKFTVFTFSNPDAALTARVVALQKDFPDSELKAAACH